MTKCPAATTDVPFARLADGDLVTAGRRVSKGMVLCAGLLAWRRHPVLGLALGDLGDAWRRTIGTGAGLARFSMLGPARRPLRFIPGRTDV
ncbi:hypothetical protein [Rhizobacter sp. SG703]|uniref:hypothetical protein n=1 Tax=Rhizobacter sp. SG703 TaxID=2587140 RepID=UPI0014483291|nr:hypothetical protein [Rhizobacter sp. SG703]NKI94400.1 hypothetical protein [Rhizobacter sp. SG703]